MKKVTLFWNWFQDNEKLIYNAIKTGNNKQLIWLHLIRNYTYLSPDIILLMQTSITQQHKITFIFSAKGNKEQFPILIALEEQAPKLKHFVPQAFIKPMVNKIDIKNGTDSPYIFSQYQLKISSIYLSLIDYNSYTKQLKIRLHIPNYNSLKNYNCLEKNIEILLCTILGEIDFRNHIEEMVYTQLDSSIPGLLSLIELPEYIAYLYHIYSK
tara:strand:+ start:288 stop:923 length:636 start_codon:yes stop_codon:yes gene_type:complete